MRVENKYAFLSLSTLAICSDKIAYNIPSVKISAVYYRGGKETVYGRKMIFLVHARILAVEWKEDQNATVPQNQRN